MSYDFAKQVIISKSNILSIFKLKSKLLLTYDEVREIMASTSQRPQRTRAHLIRLQDYEVVGDDEVTTDGELVHFSLLVGAKTINYIEDLKNMKWKFAMVEELQTIEINNTWELVELPTPTKAIEVK